MVRSICLCTIRDKGLKLWVVVSLVVIPPHFPGIEVRQGTDYHSSSFSLSNNMMNGEWYNPDTKSNVTLQEAIDDGHLIPETVFFVDQATGRITTLASGIQDGKLYQSPQGL